MELKKPHQQEQKQEHQGEDSVQNISSNFILSVVTLVCGGIISFIVVKTRVGFFEKKQEEHKDRIGEHSRMLERLNLDVSSKISRDHAYENFVTKEELRLNLENISIKLDASNYKQDQIINMMSKCLK